MRHVGLVESGLREHGLYATWLFMCFHEDRNNLSLTNAYHMVTPGKLSSLLVRYTWPGIWVWSIGVVSVCG